MAQTIDLGDKVRDTVTGYEGVVVARTEWLHGCVRLQVQSQVLKDGIPVDGYVIDEAQAELLEESAVPGFDDSPRRAGGRPAMARAKEPTR